MYEKGVLRHHTCIAIAPFFAPLTYLDRQYSHADQTWTDIVRDDHSTFHVADYDPDTGALVDQGQFYLAYALLLSSWEVDITLTSP